MNEALAEEYVTAANSNDLRRLLALYTEDVVFHDFVFGQPIRGKAQLETAVRFLQEFFPSTLEAVSCSGAADCVVLEWIWKAKHRLPFMGFDASGKETEVAGVTVFTLERGKIATQHDYWDGATVLRQLGAISSGLGL